MTITLPSVSSSKGDTYTIKKIDSSGLGVTIDGNGPVIDDATTQVITDQYVSITVLSDGVKWWIM